MTTRSRERDSGVRTAVRILFGCIGISLIVFGLAIMGIEISQSSTLGQWRATTLLDVAQSSYGRQILPDALVFWLAMPRTFKTLRDITVWTLDFMPVWLGAIVVGGVIMFKTLRS
jgi:hypothetical protein